MNKVKFTRNFYLHFQISNRHKICYKLLSFKPEHIESRIEKHFLNSKHENIQKNLQRYINGIKVESYK